jgi:hypothetical protein
MCYVLRLFFILLGLYVLYWISNYVTSVLTNKEISQQEKSCVI